MFCHLWEQLVHHGFLMLVNVYASEEKNWYGFGFGLNFVLVFLMHYPEQIHIPLGVWKEC